MSCWRTAPTAVSEASVTMQVGASGMGCTKSDASARASLILVRADSAAGDQFKGAWLCCAEESILLGGTRMAAQLGTKRW